MNKFKYLSKLLLSMLLLMSLVYPVTKVQAQPDEGLERDLTKYSLEDITGPTEADFVVVGSYNTFNEALKAMKDQYSTTSNLVIRHQSSKSPLKIIAANRAKAMSYPYRSGIESADVIMNIRSNPNLQYSSSYYQDTYINGYRILDYFETHFSTTRNNFVAKINVAGNTGYVDQQKIDIIPMIFIEKAWRIPLGGRTTSTYNYGVFYRVINDQYYQAVTNSSSGRKEIQFVYPNPKSTTTSATMRTTYGLAPAWMKTGVRYYSLNGIDFYSDRMMTQKASAEKYYNYYQYLPIHSKSFITREVIDRYISSVLKKTSSNSVMYNLGFAFMNGQVKYDMNALMFVSLAAIESAWGSSNIALRKNNLFGWNAVDSSPGSSASSYPHPANSVDDHMRVNIEGYGHVSYNHIGNHFRGAYFGNKANGFNLKYASDPYWGVSVASVAFTLDKYNGLKDWGNFTLGILKDKVDIPVFKNLNSTDTYYTYPSGERNLTHQTVIVVPDANVEKLGMYKVRLTTPMVRDSKTRYRQAYDWEMTFGYIAKENIVQIAYANGKGTLPKDPALVPTPELPSEPTPPVEADMFGAHGVYEITATAGLRLRSEPNTSSTTLTTLAYKTRVQGLPYNGEWLKVTYGTRSGFVSSQYAKQITPPNTESLESTGNGLNVRLEPSTSATSLATLNVGDKIAGVSLDKDWVWTLYNGKPAFVSARYLKPATSTPQQPVINKTVLKTTIDKANAYKAADYTSASFQALQTTIKNAQAVYDKAAATQAEVNAQVSALNSAIDKLVNKSELKATLDKAVAYKATDYTDASYQKLQTAIKNAQAIYDKASATQAEINGQVTALNSSISNLVKKPVETTTNKYRITSTSGLIVRSSTSTSSSRLGLLPHNTIVEGKPVGDGTWIQISYQGKTGYIFAQYTEKQVEATVKLGDINGDGRINSQDYVAIANHILGKKVLTGNDLIAADVNKDGKVNSQDYVAIANHILGKELIP